MKYKYSTDTFYIEQLQSLDALNLNKLLVLNTEHFKRYLPVTLAANRTLESTKEYIAQKVKMMQSRSEYIFTIKDKTTKAIAGLVILKEIDWDKKQAEFAYCIGKQYEGAGWMRASIKVLSEYAFNELKLKTLQIISHKSNIGSIKVAEKSNFIWKETLKNEFTPLNESPLDMELYVQTAK